jgi:hypothetical protein
MHIYKFLVLYFVNCPIHIYYYIEDIWRAHSIRFIRPICKSWITITFFVSWWSHTSLDDSYWRMWEYIWWAQWQNMDTSHSSWQFLW